MASATVERLLSTLTEREQLVVRLRFREDLTQTEIGRRIGCSQMHVSRILRGALAQLVENATAGPGEQRGLTQRSIGHLRRTG
jgi:RNA polymerase sigma-B factor